MIEARERLLNKADMLSYIIGRKVQYIHRDSLPRFSEEGEVPSDVDLVIIDAFEIGYDMFRKIVRRPHGTPVLAATSTYDTIHKLSDSDKSEVKSTGVLDIIDFSEISPTTINSLLPTRK